MKEILISIAFLCEPSYQMTERSNCSKTEKILQRKVDNCKKYLIKCVNKQLEVNKTPTGRIALNECLEELGVNNG